MFLRKTGILCLFFAHLFFSYQGFAQNPDENEDLQEILQQGIELLNHYFGEQGGWVVTNPEIKDDVGALLHFIGDKPIDAALRGVNEVVSLPDSNLVFRLPEYASDSLSIPGYFASDQLNREIERIRSDVQAEFSEKEPMIPLSLFNEIQQKADLLDSTEISRLFADSVFVMPDHLRMYDVIPDSVLDSDESFGRLLELDSMRKAYAAQVLKAYNDSLIAAYRDSVAHQYAREQMEETYRRRVKQLTDSVKINNYQVLRNHNDSVVHAVNQSIFQILNDLTDYAQFIDTTKLNVVNITGDETSIILGNDRTDNSRFWLKNEQNDSLSVFMRSLGKNSIQIYIDDGVTFTRFTPRETRQFDFGELTNSVSELTNVYNRYEVRTPWEIGGDGNLGFTQTYVENWKKGGKSALSFLTVLKGFANYSSSDEKVKWENSGEIRNGWIRQGGEDAELQKNDDRFEITSRFGISAFKKWFYSGELNYETQLFRGYRYPRSENPDPISAFMAPARTFFKLGLDYKPNKNFSLLLSPFTLKNVYVRDTMKIDQTKFGIDADRKSFWETGLNADINFKKEVTDNISYETKYKMFIDYQEPFKKYDINWENQLTMKLNSYIDFRLLVHLIYDDDVLFPVYDLYGNKTGEEPKLQVKELITIGFSYKINRNITRTRRLR